MKTHGGVDNAEREGNFDKEGTLAKEQAAGRKNDAEYNRMMHGDPDPDRDKDKD
jgi:hypothetical protein